MSFRYLLLLAAAGHSAAPDATGDRTPAPIQAGTAQAAKAEQADAAPFVGHWYLHGVRETGSELLLRADGSFDWFISYGAIDQTAKGTWAHDGAAVVLTVSPRDASQPLFALLDNEPWGVRIEQELHEREAARQRAAVIARCPFLDAGQTTDAASSPRLFDDKAPDAATLRAKADGAHRAALAARSRAEQAAQAALALPGEASTEAARSALGQWNESWSEARAAAREAGLAMPELADPVMPPACTFPASPDARALPPSQWTGGVAVRVVDPERGISAKEVRVALRFADGHAEQIVTAARGLAIRAGKPASPVVELALSAPFAPGRDAVLTIPPTRSGVVHVSIDAGQLIEPPFTTLRLRVDGDALIADGMGEGRYVRGR